MFPTSATACRRRSARRCCKKGSVRRRVPGPDRSCSVPDVGQIIGCRAADVDFRRVGVQRVGRIRRLRHLGGGGVEILHVFLPVGGNGLTGFQDQNLEVFLGQFKGDDAAGHAGSDDDDIIGIAVRGGSGVAAIGLHGKLLRSGLGRRLDERVERRGLLRPVAETHHRITHGVSLQSPPDPAFHIGIARYHDRVVLFARRVPASQQP
jgi:hypothetical protein